MAKTVALIEQVEATAREMHGILRAVERDVEELRSKLPGLRGYIENLLNAIGAPVLDDDKEKEDLESIDLDFGGGEDEPENLI